MEDKVGGFVKKLIEEGSNRHEARRGLVREGYSTEGFNELYDAALAQLGVAEPKDKMPDLSATGEMILKERPLDKASPLVRGIKTLLLFSILLCSVIAGCYFLYVHLRAPSVSEAPIQWGTPNATVKQNKSLGFGDSIVQAKVKATTASARIYGKRMEGFGGVCRDISVVLPVVCQETEATFVVYAALSDGTYFCEDTAENNVILTKKPVGLGSCIQ